jgi:PAS domain S-box-containing protein
MKQSLNIKINLIIILVVTTILVLFGTIEIIMIYSEMGKEQELALSKSTTGLARQLARSVFDYNREQLDSDIFNEMKDRDVYAIIVRDSLDNTIMSGKIRNQEWKIRDLDASDKLPAFFNKKLPIVFNDKELGTVEVYFSNKFIKEQIFKTITNRIITIVLLLVVTVITLSIVISVKVLRPIITLENTFNIISQGNLDQQIDTSRTDELGNLARSFAHMRDSIQTTISNLAEKNKELIESEERFRSLVQTAASVILCLSPDHRVIEINPEAERFYGCKREEVLGKNYLDLFVPEKEQDAIADDIKKVLSGEPTKGFENKVFAFDGSERALIWNISRMLDSKGEPIGIIAVGQDITERKRMEEALRISEEKYRLLVENANDGIVIIQDGVIKFANPRALKVAGYSANELITMPFIELVEEGDKNIIISRYKARLAGKELTSNYSFRIKNKSGEELWVDASSVLITWEGQPAVLNFLRDITEQRKLETLLQQAQKMESIGTLAGGIAHDFNNILASVIGYTELALDDVEKGSLLYENLQEVFIAGQRAKDLVKQILTFSRQVEQELKPLQPKFIVKEALKLLRASIPSTIEIEQNVQSNAFVMGDSTQIHQVLMNLCTNAAHAMEDKGGQLTINLSDIELDSEFVSNHPDLKQGPYINITVTDTGYGMPSDVMEKMFDPFFTTKEKGEGTGMGLSVVHGIVHSHGGTIYAYSEPGKGSIFKVFLPALERRLEAEDKVERPIPTGTECILFIDDEPTIVNMGKKTLESLGYNVTARTSSVDALKLFKEKTDRFDLVITDMTMPQMTGDNLARELMRIRSDIPVILCSGFSARIDEKQAMAMGIRAFISKPILKREIAETIRKVIDSS